MIRPRSSSMKNACLLAEETTPPKPLAMYGAARTYEGKAGQLVKYSAA
jgi:hypothetical protein